MLPETAAPDSNHGSRVFSETYSHVAGLIDWLDSENLHEVDQTHPVMASGKLTLQKNVVTKNKSEPTET